MQLQLIGIGCNMVILLCFIYLVSRGGVIADTVCDVRTRIQTGWLCGLRRIADYGVEYASFRGIPYAQQPLGVLRFQELQPAKPWPHHLNATVEGPRCPQHDEVYGDLVTLGRGMSEACIFANVHTPLSALSWRKENPESRLPILVFVHGGGFQCGAGDADIYGPEYLVAKGVVVITFNYRINVFGFLSLNSSLVPGNAGLRDVVTLLRWVQRNAQAFGGDPDNVTIGGHSAGAAMAHLISLSNAAKGLFRRFLLMSGSALPAFYTTSPIYSSYVTTLFLTTLGLNSTDPDSIHDQLINMPIERIMNANSIVQYQTGLVSFSPVVESQHPGVTRIIDSDPITLLKEGRGNYPAIIGTVTEECELFKWRLAYLDIIKRIKDNPLMVLALRQAFTVPPNVGLYLAEKVIDRYFPGKMNIDKYLKICVDTLFTYSAFKVAQWRVAMSGKPIYQYIYSYESEVNLLKDKFHLKYRGVAHTEDLSRIFRPNGALDSKAYPMTDRDRAMTDWIVHFVVNFMHCSDPTCGEESAWPPVHSERNRQAISEPGVYRNVLPTTGERDMIRFHDQLDEIARNSTIYGA